MNTNNMDFENQDPLWTTEWPEVPPTYLSSDNMSSGHHELGGYPWSPYEFDLDTSQMSFPPIRPKANVHTQSLLTSPLESHRDTTFNTMQFSSSLADGPVLTASPGPPSAANQLGTVHSPYQSLPPFATTLYQDTHLSQRFDNLDMSLLHDPGSLPPEWFGIYTGSLNSSPMNASTTYERYITSNSTDNSSTRFSYPRTLPSFLLISKPTPVVPTSIEAASTSLDSPSVTSEFTFEQKPAAQRILDFIQANPTTVIPAALITSELVDVFEGYGWCLIGNCGRVRAEQKSDPTYDSSKDTTTHKRIDLLYDHIRDKHFDCRPFHCGQCAGSFVREHDLKRHELMHRQSCYSCGYCERIYSREDNVKRHLGQKHAGMPLKYTYDQENGLYDPR